VMNARQARSIGGRIREIRSWRGMNLKVTAELAGITESYLSRIERNERPVSRRSLLEAIAAALRVAPSELAGQAFPPSAKADQATVEIQAAITALDAALSDYELGEPTGETARPWPAVAAELDRLNTQLRPAADYAAEGAVLPGLIAELHTLYVTDPDHRTEILCALMDCYVATGFLLKHQGVYGLPSLAAFRARHVAEELDDPAWLGLAAFLKASTLGGKARPRMLVLSMQAANELAPHLDDSRAAQMYGMLHLNVALASAALCRADDAADHLDEAAMVAQRVSADGCEFGNFGHQGFSADNVGIWRLAIAVELGEGGRVREIARTVDLSRVPSASRQAMFWADLGCGMAQERSMRDEAVEALLRAEKIAPQRIHANPFVRETVGDLLRRRVQRDSVGRELRGMAWRMGVGVG
jgi:transcriptional regulator with XRE-family HTH domain